MNLICEYQSNYNGWSINPEENNISEKVAEQVTDLLPMVTWEMCDDDGYYSGSKFSNSMMTKILETVQTIIPECSTVTVTFDKISS